MANSLHRDIQLENLSLERRVKSHGNYAGLYDAAITDNAATNAAGGSKVVLETLLPQKESSSVGATTNQITVGATGVYEVFISAACVGGGTPPTANDIIELFVYNVTTAASIPQSDIRAGLTVVAAGISLSNSCVANLQAGDKLELRVSNVTRASTNLTFTMAQMRIQQIGLL